MTLPLRPPFPPMEAKSVDEIPAGDAWQYEPKWDGFRCLVFRDGDKIELQSKSGQPLTRYFPDLVACVRALKAKRCVLDGEIAVPNNGGFSFDALLQRIHPAASRINRLAKETPATFIVFDLLVDESGASLVKEILSSRRTSLERFAKKFLRDNRCIRLSPTTTRLADARKWLKGVGANLDGIVAKDRTADYRSGERSGMQKIKNFRSADCVVGGFR
ncbi:MAG TPA: ATP-dependent DNA ligase, partial [Pseudolabrys sp.]|nr:ATP-dependent DNA ligase [Pseudolabrys sp.]